MERSAQGRCIWLTSGVYEEINIHRNHGSQCLRIKRVLIYAANLNYLNRPGLAGWHEKVISSGVIVANDSGRSYIQESL